MCFLSKNLDALENNLYVWMSQKYRDESKWYTEFVIRIHFLRPRNFVQISLILEQECKYIIIC